MRTVMEILSQTGKLPRLTRGSYLNDYSVLIAGNSRHLILNRVAVDQMEQPEYRNMLLECLRRPAVRQADFWMRLDDDIIRDLSALMKHQTPVQESAAAPQSEAPPVKFLPQIPKALVSKVNVKVRKWSSMRP